MRRSTTRNGIAGVLCAAAMMLGISPAAAAPYQYDDSANAPPGTLIHVFLPYHFRDTGTNPRFTEWSFSPAEHLVESDTVLNPMDNRRLFFRIKPPEQLNALATPPPANFETALTVKMTNDEGETASGTITLKSGYVRNPTARAPAEPEPEPIPTVATGTALAPPGETVTFSPDDLFQNTGTNPRFTQARFQSKYYYDADKSGLNDGNLQVTAKSADGLRALGHPPPNPFRLRITLTVTNDEGYTNTGVVTFTTSW